MVDDMGNNAEENFEMIPDEEEGLDISGAAAKIKKLRDDLKQCNAERKEYLDGWQRAKADFINYRKDEAARFAETAQFVVAGFVHELLPVLDSFDLAISHGISPGGEKGILLIRSQLSDALKKYGIEEISALGAPFNPEYHESMGEEESEKPEGTVIAELQKGYVMKGKVLRPARVKIAKKK